MRERTKRYIKRYSSHAIDMATGVLYWVPIIAIVYAHVLYVNVYGTQDK